LAPVITFVLAMRAGLPAVLPIREGSQASFPLSLGTILGYGMPEF